MPEPHARRAQGPALLAVHSALTGGAQLMALATAERLSRSYELLIVVPRGPLRDAFAKHGELVRASPTLPFGWNAGMRWPLQIARSVIDGVRLAVLVRRRGVRVIVTNSTILLGPVLAARLARVPVVVHAREIAGNAAEARAFAAVGRLADEVIAVSGAVGAGFGPRTRVVRIADGVPIPPEPVSRSGFAVPLRLCLIGTVSSDGNKGHDLAIASLARLVEAGVDARLDCVGPIQGDAVANELRALASRLGVGERVELRGPTRDIDGALEHTDILLSCSGREALGLTLMEALVRCKPVVATRAGGPEEVLRDGETGLLVELGNPDAVARAILSLVADPAAARAMAQRGRNDMIERFDRERGLDALADEFDRLAGADVAHEARSLSSVAK
jgi:glycosyltransferase involved in cell wall biosynthesis